MGHVRYGTAGAKSWEASQPHLSTINSVIIALAHNGTLVNTDELRRQLIELGVPFLSNSDSEVATKLIGYFTQRTGHLREGIRKTMELVRGGYAMTLINEQALYAFRDPHGIRPLVLGKLVDEGLDQADAASVSQLPSQDGAATVDSAVRVTRAGGWVVASETCALDIVGAEYVRDVRPGEILRISAEGLVSEQGVPAAEEPANCIFEQVYFARPDSIMNGKSVMPAVTTWVVSWHMRSLSRLTWSSACPTPACRLRRGIRTRAVFPLARALSRTATWAVRLSSLRRSCAPWACV